MATLDYIEGFEHQTLSSLQLSGSGNGIFDSISNAAGLTFVTGRHGQGLKVTEDGVTATYARVKVPTSQTRLLSYYLNTTATPGADSTVVSIFDTSFVRMHRTILRSTGILRADIGTAGSVGSTVINDGNDHRIDIKLVTSGTTWTLDWAIDGVDQGQQTLGSQVATDSVWIAFGSSTAAHTAVFIVDDVVASVTSGDYPLGEYIVDGLFPTADGTHVAGTNVIESDSGSDIGVGNPAWPLIDEWPANSTDYIQQSATGSGNYAEVTFGAATGTPAAVKGYAAVFSSGTAGNNATVRIVDSGGTTLTDIYSGAINVTVPHYRSALIAAPGGTWTSANLSAVKGRFGLSSDATPNPRITALLLQYARKPQVPLTPGLLDQSGVLFAPSFGRQIAPGFISQVPALFGPKFNLTVALGFIDQTAVTYAPVFSKATAQVVNMQGGWGGAPWGTYNWGGGQGSFIDRTGTLFAPNFQRSIMPALLDQSGVLFGPTFIIKTITFPLIDNSNVIYQPQLNQQVQVPLLDQSGVLYGPTIKNPQTVTFPLLDQTGVLYAPGLNSKTLPIPLIDNSNVMYQPQFNQKVTMGFIDQTAVLFPPGIGRVVVAKPTIDQTGVLFAPQFNFSPTVPLLDQSGVLYGPQFNQMVGLGLIQSSTIFAPNFQKRVTLPLIDNSPQLFGAIFIRGNGKLVNVGFIQNSATFAPSFQTPNKNIIRGKKGVYDRTISGKKGAMPKTISKKGNAPVTISLKGSVPEDET
jgi:hypothetical protein